MRRAVSIGLILFSILLAGCGYRPYGGGSVYQDPNEASGWATNDERYRWFLSNQVQITENQPVSAIAMDVDTASYAIVRRYLNDETLPPRAAIRIEELVNYFPYEFPPPRSIEERLSLTGTVFPTPWNPDTLLMHVGVRAYNLPFEERPPANLVFLVDTSGSLDAPEELALIKKVLTEAVDLLRPQDRVSIVAYASSVDRALEPTPASKKEQIKEVIRGLYPGGFSSGGPAIQVAYEQAEAMFDPAAANRIILISDGDFNFWYGDIQSSWDLWQFVERKREEGIYLSVIGVGSGDLDDRMMQQLAESGDGIAAYVDSPAEARKVLIEGFGANLFPIADEARMLVEFNPARVAEYRLIGYETRRQSAGEFTDPRNNAGEIGSGHTLSVLYEIVPPDSPARRLLPLRYGVEPEPRPAGFEGEFALVRVRYKKPGEVRDRRKEFVIDTSLQQHNLATTPADHRFAAAVAAFGETLRGEGFVGSEFRYDDIYALAEGALGSDPEGYRAGFLRLVSQAKSIDCKLARVPKPGCPAKDRRETAKLTQK